VQVFGGDPKASRRIYQLSREVIEFQRAVDPLAYLLDELHATLKQRGEGPDLELRRLLRDDADHAIRVIERLAGDRELLTNILQVNATLVGQRQNEEMARMTEAGFVQNEQVKRISSWAAIFFAPSFVAGVRHELRPDAELSWSPAPVRAAARSAAVGALYGVRKKMADRAGPADSAAGEAPRFMNASRRIVPQRQASAWP
jgi:hypothetical protein